MQVTTMTNNHHCNGNVYKHVKIINCQVLYECLKSSQKVVRPLPDEVLWPYNIIYRTPLEKFYLSQSQNFEFKLMEKHESRRIPTMTISSAEIFNNHS